MAGAFVEIEIRDEQLTALMQDLAGRMTDMTPVFREIGEIALESIQRNFEEERAPDGGRWAPLSPATLRRRRHSGNILRDTQTLFRSIHPSPGPRSVRVGTNIIYAAAHQFGIGPYSHLATRRRMPGIPARPFLGLRDDDWPEIRAAVGAWITEGR